MDHADHLALLRPGISARGGTWADIGAGRGAFTLALADLIGPEGTIIALDRDEQALHHNQRAMAARFPGVNLITTTADLMHPTDLPTLDGLVAANSLHFVSRDRQVEVVRRLASVLRPGGTFIVVEYDSDQGNPWVPYPFAEPAWGRLATEAGLVDARPLARVPSRFLGAIYAAVAHRSSEASSASISDGSL